MRSEGWGSDLIGLASSGKGPQKAGSPASRARNVGTQGDSSRRSREAPQKKPTLQAPRLWPPGLREVDVCWVSPQVSGVSLGMQADEDTGRPALRANAYIFHVFL